MSPDRRSVKRLRLASLMAAMLAGAPAAAASFDGLWSVLIITERGTCDVYRWEVSVVGGRFQTDMAQVAGGVDARGGVQATFIRGSDRLSASGRLSGYFGSGRSVP